MMFKVSSLLSCLTLVSFMSVTCAADSPRYMVFASDPQYPWTPSSDNGAHETGSQRDSLSRNLIETQFSSIASFRMANGGVQAVPVMINGDMTAFGHGDQRSMTRSILDAQLAGVYDYGLGNHDYENNVDDCFWNNCAAGSIVDFKDRYFGKLTTLDMRLSDDGAIKKGVFGSLAYSRDFGDVHMVQLHNEPTYSTAFTAWNWGTPTGYHISDSLDWLERDLKWAREQGKIIILNMHKPDRWQGSSQQIDRFEKMLSDYKVTVIFAGHHHWRNGYYDEINGVPVYVSGSASEQTYLIASFSANRTELVVERIKDNNWQGRYPVHSTAVRK